MFCRLPEAEFSIGLHRQLQRSSSGEHLCLPQPSSAAATDGAGTAAAAAATAAGNAQGLPAGLAGTEVVGASSPTPGQAFQQQQQQAGGLSSQERVQKLAHKQQLVVPGPEEICPSDVPWGTNNCWIEPWDAAAGVAHGVQGQPGLAVLLWSFHFCRNSPDESAAAQVRLAA
jgi:hypothetical protein